MITPAEYTCILDQVDRVAADKRGRHYETARTVLAVMRVLEKVMDSQCELAAKPGMVLDDVAAELEILHEELQADAEVAAAERKVWDANP